ncbi:hypothetical protein VTK73DRAFT_5471 [Phialemonium thermophilum]|uniref:ATP-dependent RNA helicase n=1 Tax=Phialemonium thermophilum TaxID=223376 RepID=A0ABR3V1K3_9PEZI
MHSRMSQPARNRTVEEFKAAASGVLFASDVVGRGMDFPDIGLVVQVGLPSDKEQYVHRVGRTGRAGKLGRAVMVLIPEERRFVQKNPEFPIRNASLPDIEGTRSRQIIDQALANVPEAAKVQAYVSFLGFTKTLTKVHGLPAAGVVALANRYAASLGLASPPVLEAQTVGKMGLKGVPGLNVRSGGGGGGGGGGGRRGRGGGRGAGAGAGGGGGGGNGGGAPGGQPNKKRTFSKRD